MKMIGWIVTSSKRSGTRGIERRLRAVSNAVSPTKRLTGFRERSGAAIRPWSSAIAWLLIS